jgi:hypothetical protein
MVDDQELLLLRDRAKLAEDRYLRLKWFFKDPATVAAAHQIWNDAAMALRFHEGDAANQKAW